jgi:hypothetical protein
MLALLRGGGVANLAESTQHARRLILDAFNAEYGHHRLADIEPRHVRRWRDLRADRAEAANAFLKVLRQVFKWGCDPTATYAMRDPTFGVPYIRVETEGFHTWTVEDVLQSVPQLSPVVLTRRARLGHPAIHRSRALRRGEFRAAAM